MRSAAIGPIAVHFPEKIETNQQLADAYPRWNMDLIYSKTGIGQRHIAAPGECASDLGVAAAEKLFEQHDIDRKSIDFLLFCTQSPDAPLPTTACLMQHRLGLPTRAGALDFNLGCSGFIYGLAMADGLIRTGSVRRVLLITAETYSKYISEDDRSLRTIFGDGAAATLVEASPDQSLGSFIYGTNGKGADTLLVCGVGHRPEEEQIKPRGRRRWSSELYMDGPSLIDFTLTVVPPMVEQVLTHAGWTDRDVDLYLMHQATLKMLGELQGAMKIDPDKMPVLLERCGNTVSSTIPVLIHDLRAGGQLRPGLRTVMAGFGVGLSWGGCAWTETWSGGSS